VATFENEEAPPEPAKLEGSGFLGGGGAKTNKNKRAMRLCEAARAAARFLSVVAQILSLPLDHRHRFSNPTT
jgi:hypothetical protein